MLFSGRHRAPSTEHRAPSTKHQKELYAARPPIGDSTLLVQARPYGGDGADHRRRHRRRDRGVQRGRSDDPAAAALCARRAPGRRARSVSPGRRAQLEPDAREDRRLAAAAGAVRGVRGLHLAAVRSHGRSRGTGAAARAGRDHRAVPDAGRAADCRPRVRRRRRPARRRPRRADQRRTLAAPIRRPSRRRGRPGVVERSVLHHRRRDAAAVPADRRRRAAVGAGQREGERP